MGSVNLQVLDIREKDGEGGGDRMQDQINLGKETQYRGGQKVGLEL